MKIINIKKPKESYVTEEEIKAIVQEGMETGVVQEIEQDIVENVFYLGDRKVKTLMTPRHDIEWIDMNDSDDKIKKKIISSSHKSFPVAQGDVNKMKGMLHSKEILNTLLQRNYFDIKQSLKPVFYLSENTTAYKALEKMRENKERVSLIVNEFGDVQGILSMNDLVNALVGDFAEQLHESREIIPRDDGSFLVDAALPFAEFTRYFEIDIEGDESVENINSVGGFLFHQANAIPKTGFKIQWKNLELEIIDMDRRRIDKVLVKRREDL